MAEPLNVIALVSGGKDSIFSILHCLENGHKIVALANLFPRSSATAVGGGDLEGDDLNSFMYQTVGHSVIPLYTECLDVPLYRREINGSAIQTGRYYDASKDGGSLDETEDLMPLLEEVMHAHPSANALCSGAILSTYQRTRVESVAVRLGLVPLAYLWQYPALPPPRGRGESLTGLLDDMEAAGCDARIIKIASGGIKESLLWANVADPKTRFRLVHGLRPFFPAREFWLRGAVLGEGGEYETLAVNGPSRLWKKRIEFPQDMSSFGAEGGVRYLRLGRPQTVDNPPILEGDVAEALRVPQTFDAQFQSVLTLIQGSNMLEALQNRGKGNEDNRGGSLLSSLPAQHAERLTQNHLSISNMTARNSDTASGQMKQICVDLKSTFDALSITLSRPKALCASDIVSTMLLLKDMSNFAAVNTVYSTLFVEGQPNPPSRVTIACSLPEAVDVSLSVVLDLGPSDARRGLHVQSRSYWAPANIGPYSQAICVSMDQNLIQGQSHSVNVHDAELVETVHMAGQIPLTPQTMQLFGADFPEQALLSVQHLWRVGQDRGADIWPWGVAFLESSAGKDSSNRAEVCWQIWQSSHLVGTWPEETSGADSDGDDGPDAWDLLYNRTAMNDTAGNAALSGQHLHRLPNPAVFKDPDNTSISVPPLIAAEVVSLPRSASVEWWSMGIANLPKILASKARVSLAGKNYSWGSIADMMILPASPSEEDRSVHLITVLVSQGCVRDVERDILDIISQNDEASQSIEVIYGTVFVSVREQEQWSRMGEDLLLQDLAIIPCEAVFGSLNSGLKVGVDELEDRCSRAHVNAASTELGQENDNAKPSGMQPLAYAVTVRVDQRHSGRGLWS